MKQIVLFLSVGMASGLLMVNMYTSLIDARSWGSDIPNSIGVAREYFKVINPGDFFRIFSPVNQVIALIGLIIFWRSDPSVRIYLGAALILYVLVDVLTFGYFYPRNEILFKTAQLTDTELFKKIWSEWTTMNWIRSLMLLVGIVVTFLSIHRIYSPKI